MLISNEKRGDTVQCIPLLVMGSSEQGEKLSSPLHPEGRRQPQFRLPRQTEEGQGESGQPTTAGPQVSMEPSWTVLIPWLWGSLHHQPDRTESQLGNIPANYLRGSDLEDNCRGDTDPDCEWPHH